MAISSVNTYNTVAENAYATQKRQISEQEKTKGTTTAKEAKISTNEYMQKLQTMQALKQSSILTEL